MTYSSDSDSDADPFAFKPTALCTNRRRHKRECPSSSSDSEESFECIKRKRPAKSRRPAKSPDKEALPPNQERISSVERPMILEINSSSDDDSVSIVAEKTNCETVDALRKAHEAVAALKRAQESNLSASRCSGENEDDFDSDDGLVVVEPNIPPLRPSYQNDENLGAIINLQVRSKCGSNIKIKIKMREKLSKLVVSCKESKFLSSTAQLKFIFEGQPLDLALSPQNYDMEDEDIIDAQITGTTPHTKIEEERVVLITRHNGSTRKWTLKRCDPFQKLVDAFLAEKNDVRNVRLEYNSRSLGLQSTPKKEGMKGEVFLDIYYLEIPEDKVCLKLRINGKDDQVKDYKIGQNDKFQLLMNSFCKNNDCSEDNVSFMLDGEKMSMAATARGEDLEGGEIIDVVLKKASFPSLTGSITALTIQTIRNKKTQYRPKKFRLSTNDTILKLKQGYIDYYRSKGCRKVNFYYNELLVKDEEKTFASLGVKEMDVFYAMENGSVF